MSAVLSRKVLCLNKSWNAAGIVTIRRAVNLLFKTYANGEPYAKIIDPTQEFQTFTWDDWAKLRPKEGEDGLRTNSVIFRIPKVILLSRYDKLPLQRINFSRRSLYRRDGNQCQYCGACPGTEELSIDHIIPKSMGGRSSWENTCLACTTCNRRKADRTMDEARMKFFHPGFKPTKPKFNLFKGDVIIEDWKHFLSEAFWTTPLQD